MMVSASIGLATTALIGLAAVPAGAASSAPTAAAPASVESTGAHAASLSSAPSGAAKAIVCTPQVQNPHNSSHVNGTVNIVVTLKCTSAVPQINIRAALYFDGRLVKQSGQRTVRNSSSAKNNAAVPCRSGTYQGWMSFGVLFPPGYVPPTGASSGFGRAVPISC